MAKKYYRWYYKWPNMDHVFGPTAETYNNEREVRSMLREAHGYKRLPRGTKVWIALNYYKEKP